MTDMTNSLALNLPFNLTSVLFERCFLHDFSSKVPTQYLFLALVTKKKKALFSLIMVV